MNEKDRKKLVLICKQACKCLIIYVLSVVWITAVTIYANIANIIGLFYLVAFGLFILLLVGVLTNKNKCLEMWILYFFIIFVCAGATVGVFVETKIIAQLVKYFS
jgi:hypothetical protein